MDILHSLLILTIVYTLAAASPGPDFVFVSQQTLNGKRTGLLCSLGIALGLSVHIAYSALGLATVVAHFSELLVWIKVLGGCYLIFLGAKGLRARASAGGIVDMTNKRSPGSAVKTIGAGFLCNALNPKAPICFLSLFTLILSPDMSLHQVAIFGLWIMMIQLIWFSFVVFVLSTPVVNRRFQRAGHWVDRMLGGAMVLLWYKGTCRKGQLAF